MVTSSAAVVYDNSLFGATSPIMGQRYRIEASPLLGDLTLVNVLVDVRKYIMPARPFTLAGRIMHTGRYGPDQDNPRLYPLFLGYKAVVRGYPQDAFQTNTLGCFLGVAPCSSINQLLGSKILAANVEFRFPLFGVLGLGSGYYGGLPIEMAFFADGGVAWTGTDQAWFLGGTRKPVYSVGAALRMNLFGFAIVELDAVRPLSRPGSGIVWQFGLTPGF